jgi:hypothetical protein
MARTSSTARRPVPRSLHVAAAGLLLLLGACSSPSAAPSAPSRHRAEPRASSTPSPEPTPVEPPQPAALASPNAPHDALEPASWAYLPRVDPMLREALAAGEPTEVRLEALVRALAPFRWQSDDWDNLGFIRTEADAPRGFVTREDGALRMQPDGAYSLGCAGGFLEGVRVALAPALEMAELQHCDAATLAILGTTAPSTCKPEDFGLHAIANAARAAAAAGVLETPAVPLRLDPHDPAALAPLMAPGVVQLCTVSHEPTVGPPTRLHHHLMIVLRATGPRAMSLFDTTGYRGVAMRRIDAAGLSSYATKALARNEAHRYDPASARIDCLTLTRRP